MNFYKTASALCLAALLTACGGTIPLGTGQPLQPNDMLAGTPMPPGATIATEKSLLIGGSTSGHWMGRLVLSYSGSVHDALTFFQDQLPAQGWRVISSVRGEQNLMVLSRQDLTATITVSERGGLVSGAIVMTVTPANSSSQMPGAKR